ncbi:hypothetical protein LB506_010748 [Fusarium annulatum]|nr:hypothetical protein LB506_010748 [Fusarium annulatum]
MSSSPKDTVETTEPPKSSDADTQPWNDDKRRKFETKSKSEFYDPCQEAAQRSYRCLFRNGGDKNMCGDMLLGIEQSGQVLTIEQGISRLQTSMGMLYDATAEENNRNSSSTQTDKRKKEGRGWF